MNFSIRRAHEGDGAAIRRVHLASIRGLGGQAYTEEQVGAWAHERDPEDYPLEAAEATIFVAERSGSIVGFGWLSTAPDEDFQAEVDAKISAIYVHPAVAREGIGTTLYQALETRAKESGCKSLGLFASVNAVPFYEAQGYRKVREVTYEFDDSVTGPALEMKKELAD